MHALADFQTLHAQAQSLHKVLLDLDGRLKHLESPTLPLWARPAEPKPEAPPDFAARARMADAANPNAPKGFPIPTHPAPQMSAEELVARLMADPTIGTEIRARVQNFDPGRLR